MHTESGESHPSISADGSLFAYASNLSGRNEIYVDRFPDLGDRIQISTGGGVNPQWSPDGRELFYWRLDPPAMMAVPIDPTTGRPTGPP